MKSFISPKTFSLLPSSSSPKPPFLFNSCPSILQLNPKFISSLCPSFSAYVLSTLRCCSSSPSSQKMQQRSSSACSSSGEIHVIVGPMFAGKTTSLLRRIQSERSTGRKVSLIKSNKDTRYEPNSIVTHDGDKYPCCALHDLSSFRQKFGSSAYDEHLVSTLTSQLLTSGYLQLDVIGIDEAQFFEDLYDFCQRAADQDGKTIIVAGLDGDYMRKSFGSVLSIIPLADSVTKLSARCELCGKRACFTLRKTDERQTELIGGAEVYMPVCRQHYGSGQVVIETTRMLLQQKLECGG